MASGNSSIKVEGWMVCMSRLEQGCLWMVEEIEETLEYLCRNTGAEPGLRREVKGQEQKEQETQNTLLPGTILHRASGLPCLLGTATDFIFIWIMIKLSKSLV